jgi:hypothetical protein
MDELVIALAKIIYEETYHQSDLKELDPPRAPSTSDYYRIYNKLELALKEHEARQAK